jgi:hypothetical protein
MAGRWRTYGFAWIIDWAECGLIASNMSPSFKSAIFHQLELSILRNKEPLAAFLLGVLEYLKH